MRQGNRKCEILIACMLMQTPNVLCVDANGYDYLYHWSYETPQDDGWEDPVVKNFLRSSEEVTRDNGRSDERDRVVEDMPAIEREAQYIGGQDSLRNFLRKNLVYPEVAIDNNIQGKVIVQFDVDDTGTIQNPRVIRSVDPSLDQEALRVVGKMGKWQPAESIYGNKVSTGVSIPITFRLR